MMNINFSEYSEKPTIFAVSTASGQSAISVIRISGENALRVKEKFSVRTKIIPKKCHFTTLKENQRTIDHCIFLYFQAPYSFTGEDTVELHLHGSRAIIKLVLKNLGEIEGFLPAQHGEFTRRAFLNKKLDLIQAEGLLSLINSETQEQVFQANKQLSGEHSRIFQSMRDTILRVFANCEALLDFPEDDIETQQNYNKNILMIQHNEKLEDSILNQLITIQKRLQEYLNDGKIGEKIYNGFKISIIGEPNVGKSSLLNFLAKKSIAIVSDIPGTTRDLVTLNMNIEGHHVEFIDTAGIRETDDTVELMGISKTKQSIEESDLVLILSTLDNIDNYKKFISPVNDEKYFLILNKIDKLEKEFIEHNDKKYLCISIKNEINLDILFSKIKNKIVDLVSNLVPNSLSIITNSRQRSILENLDKDLDKVIKNFCHYQFLDVLTEDIRNLSKHISQLTGNIVNDNILDELFYNFCIGK